MKITVSIIITAALILYLGGCRKFSLEPSEPLATSIPEVVDVYANDSYVLGVGSGLVFKSIPDTIAKAVDTLAGFEGGFGGKTGKDTIFILKKDMKGSWPDTTKAGGFSVSFEKFNRSSFRVSVSTNIVLAAPISNPGPTEFSGNYRRTANGFIIEIVKVFNGVYVIDNPGGAGVPPTPYLLYNYKNAAGGDSLAFPAQNNPCHGGLKLVDAGAPTNLKISEYNQAYPPGYTSLNPITLAWKVFEFPDTNPSTSHTGAALCQWGLAVRTFIKQ